MGQLVVDMFVTLDGVIQAPGGPDEDRGGGFPHGGWQEPYIDQGSLEVIGKGLERMDALLLGRKTYDIFADYWPKAPADDPFAIKLNSVPKYVASRTLKTVDWHNSALITGEFKAAIERIKKDHDETHVIGSADLVQSLLSAGLVDRFVLLAYPIILGTGKRLFPEGVPPTAFKLIESRPFKGGAILMVYEPAGKPTYGTIGIETQQPN